MNKCSVSILTTVILCSAIKSNIVFSLDNSKINLYNLPKASSFLLSGGLDYLPQNCSLKNSEYSILQDESESDKQKSRSTNYAASTRAVADNWLNREVARQVFNNSSRYAELTQSHYDSITQLFLTDGRVTGSIPSDISKLRNLEILGLQKNGLTGSIPASIGNLTKLTYISLGGNQLTGSIPSELGNLKNLKTLRLYSNKLTGEIPQSIYNLSNLETLELYSNQLTGTISPNLSKLTKLHTLMIGSNNFSGTIPAELSKLTNMELFWLEDCGLTGSIPSELSAMTKLRDLGLYKNNLTGEFPQSIANISTLRTVIVNDNKLTGDLSKIFANKGLSVNTSGDDRYTGTFYTNFSNNQFVGSKPSTLSNIGDDKFNLNLLSNMSNQKQLVYKNPITIQLEIKSKYDAFNGEVQLRLPNGSYESLGSGHSFEEYLEDSSFVSNGYAAKLGSTNIYKRIKGTSGNGYATVNNPATLKVNPSLIPIVSWQGPYTRNTFYYFEGNDTWIKQNVDMGLGFNSYVSRDTNVYPNWGEMKLTDTKGTSVTISVDYNGSTYTSSKSNNFDDHFLFQKVANVEWNNNQYWENNTLQARFYVQPKVHGAKYRIYTRSAWGDNVSDWYDSEKYLRVDGKNPSVSFDNENEKWQSASSYTLTTSISDADSGMKEKNYKTTGAQSSDGWKTLDSSIKITKQGETTVEIEGIDNVSNSDKVSTVVRLDNIEPTITASKSTTDWVQEQVTITVDCSDDNSGSGIDYIELPDGTKKTISGTKYTASATYTAKENKTYTFKVYDKAGNKSSVDVKITNIDKDTPSATFSPWEKAWTKDNVSVKVTPTDDTSKVAEWQYQLYKDGELYKDWSENQAVAGVTILLEEHGKWEINVCVKDKSGRTNYVKSGVYKIDKKDPTGEFSTIYAVVRRDITINVSNLIDNHSGLNKIVISNFSDYRNADTHPLSSKLPNTIGFRLDKKSTVETNYTERTVYIKLYDNVDNFTEYKLKVYLHPAKPGAPTISIPADNNPLYLKGNSVLLKWTHNNGENEFNLPQTKATLKIHNTDTNVIKTIVIDNDIDEYILPSLEDGQYVVTITTNNFGPYISDESSIEFRYNKFINYGLVRSILINLNSKIKYVAVETTAEIPAGCSVEGKIYYEKLPDGTMNYEKYINFDISKEYLMNIIPIKNHVSTLQVDLVLRGYDTKYLTPVLHDIKVYAK